MEAKIENGRLLISMDLEDPCPSSTGKTLIIATTHGARPTTAVFRGKPVSLVVNAFVSPDPGQILRPKPAKYAGWGKLITFEEAGGSISSKKLVRKK